MEKYIHTCISKRQIFTIHFSELVAIQLVLKLSYFTDFKKSSSNTQIRVYGSIPSLLVNTTASLYDSALMA